MGKAGMVGMICQLRTRTRDNEKERCVREKKDLLKQNRDMGTYGNHTISFVAYRNSWRHPPFASNTTSRIVWPTQVSLYKCGRDKGVV